MRNSLHFKEQVSSFTGWFADLCGTEQVIVLCTLVRKLEPTYLRLLANIVDRTDNGQLSVLEHKANDAEFVRQLSRLSVDQAAANLLALFPMLRPQDSGGMAETKRAYLDLLSALLGPGSAASVPALSTDEWSHQRHQLASLAIIHPALSPAERQGFSDWLRAVRNSGSLPPAGAGAATPLPPPAPTRADSGLELDSESPPGALASLSGLSAGVPSPMPAQNGPLQRSHQPLSRQLGLAPGGTCDTGAAAAGSSLNLLPPAAATSPNSSGFLSDHAPLSPQSSASSNGDPSCSVENLQTCGGGGKSAFYEEGMRDVPSWLKGLRLHKYAFLFKQLTYEDMLNITESWLDVKNVTKGARNKILLSVRKLQERESVLNQVMNQLNTEQVTPTQLRSCLSEIRSVLQSPLRRPLPPQSSVDSETAADVRTKKSATTDGDKIGYSGEDRASCDVAVGVESTTGDSFEKQLACDIADDPGRSTTLTSAVNPANADLPGLIISCLTKVCSLLLTSRRYEDDCYAIFTALTDCIQENEAFSDRQKNLVATWREQMARERGQNPLRKYLYTPSRGRSGGLSAVSASGPAAGSLGLPAAQWSQFSPQKACHGARRPPRIVEPSHGHLPPSVSLPLPAAAAAAPSWFGPASGASALHLPLMKHNSFTGGAPLSGAGATCGLSPEEAMMRRPVERTHSAPNQATMSAYFRAAAVQAAQQHAQVQALHQVASTAAAGGDTLERPETAEDVAINADLESLALSMTEAALEESPAL